MKILDNNILLIVYLIFGLGNYYYLKIRLKENTWSNFRFRLMFGVLGTIGTLAIFVVEFIMLLMKFDEWWKNKKFNDPPKWL